MRSIVDAHFTQNYKYYKSVCYKYYRGRYLAEDLLNESYLKFIGINEKTLRLFHEANKLHCLVLLAIRGLYQERIRAKYHEDGNTSPLYECTTKAARTSDHQLHLKADKSQDDEALDPIFELDNLAYESLNPIEIERDEQLIKRHYEQLTEIKQLMANTPVEVDKKKPSEYLKLKVFFDCNEPGNNINKMSKEIGVSRNFLTQVYKEGQQDLQRQLK